MNLINQSFIQSNILSGTKYKETHGASDDFLGSGILYYALACMIRAKTCLCLGSGGGFVPRIMRQAQRDLELDDSRTTLVDANMPHSGWGSPDYFDGSTVFTKEFDVNIMRMTTQDAFGKLNGRKVDYLHIDADHRYESVTVDFRLYKSLVTPNGVITLHDTCEEAGGKRCGVHRLVKDIRRESEEYDVVDFPLVGLGVAIIKKKLTKIHA